MKRTKGLSELAIAQKIRAGSDFVVGTKRERTMALMAGKFLGCDVVTRQLKDGKFHIIIPSEVPN